MNFSRFPCTLLTTSLIALGLVSLSHAEEKSLWQKFFFSPTPTVEGEGPEYDKLREMDKKINTLEGKYSRERRPNNKAIIRKEIDKLREERENLAEQLRKNPPRSSSSTVPTVAKSSEARSADGTVNSNASTACITDTVLVRDTVIIHDTLYVIVADMAATVPGEKSVEPPAGPAIQDTVAADSSQASQPGSK